MGKHLDSTLFLKSLRVLQSSLPIDTGNLRYNATKGYYYNNGFQLTTGGDLAPYYEFLQDESKYGRKYSFEPRSFTPVYRFLQGELQGMFGGGRFLKNMNITFQSELKTFLSSKNEYLEAREQVASRYGG
jgi:hypothetical protein